ncbi:MAG: asparagine synthetase B [Saprospiraceae bacterium]|nr:MAG: asparagine synthetase B [Saprospiraceae bacterium]
MCGISGIINFNGSQVQESHLTQMMKVMKHRGPDDNGTFVEDNIGLGFVRLSIIDLTKAGHQPMFSPDERYVMIYNGEIYNYIELKEELRGLGFSFQTKTDTEVLLTAYRAWGENMLHRLNGMWAFVIYDRVEKTIFGARDRYGIKPFYYCMDDDRFIFGSEVPCILEVLGKKPTPKLGPIFDFMVFDRTDQTNSTFFEEVKKLNHGHWFKIKIAPGESNSGQEFQLEKWYDIRKELKPPFKNPAEFWDSFSNSLGLRLRSDVPIGVCFSGGLDSSSIVSGLLKDYQMHDLNTFSAIYGAGKFGDESEFINQYQNLLKNMHFVYPDENSLHEDISNFVFAHGEPVPSTSPYAQFKVMELAHKHVTVTLDGQGADEELAGYHYFFGYHFKNLLLSGKLGRLASEMGHYMKNHRSLYGLKSLLFFLLPAHQRTFLRAFEKGYIDRDFYQAHAAQRKVIVEDLYGSPNLQEALINHFEYKLEHLLKWEDSNSMWFSIEARVPFLDHNLVERTLTLPDEFLINKGMTKHILREATKGILPEKIRMRRDKTGFGTPQDEWFRTPVFQKYINELINSESFASRNLMNIENVKTIYKDHVSRKGNHAKIIWKWIHLENWFRQFVD